MVGVHATGFLKAFVLTLEVNESVVPRTETIVVNFRTELSEIIKEAKYLDQLSFKIPESALNIALQVGDTR